MYFICNKCFATTARGRKPYSLTECGHIYCYSCVDDARKQCPQCKRSKANVMTIEPPAIQQQPFFQSLQVHVSNLKKIVDFHMFQRDILQRRFQELDEKYELLKRYFHQCMKNNKVLVERYEELKEIRKQEQKRMTLVETRYRNLVSPSNASSVFKTPSSRNIKYYAIKRNLNSNPSSKCSAGNPHNFITPAKSSQRTGQQNSASIVPGLYGLSINTPQRRQFVNPVYFQQDFPRE